MTQRPYEVQKTFSEECGLSIAMPAHTIRFTPGQAGAAVLSVYSLSGKRLAEKRTVVTQTQGSLVWRELGALPLGIYVLDMRINHKVIGKTMVCKL